MENLMSAGEFATAARLSRKALRIYGANGLLPPSQVDPANGYRYYRPQQLRTATLIALLRRSGMSLEDVMGFLLSPSAERLDTHGRRLRDEFADRQRALRHVHRMVEEELMFDVTRKTVAERAYVSRTTRLHVRDLESYVYATFAELGPADGPPLVIYHGPVNAEEDGPIEVCVPRADGDRVLPAGEVACTAVTGDECAFPQILGAYESVYRWASDNGREPDGPPREIYLSRPGEPERLEIALPVR